MASTNRIVISFLVFTISINAQIGVSNLMEFQHGQLPTDTGDYFSTFYDKATVDYSQGNYLAGISLEQFHSPFQDRNYTQLSQYRIQYAGNGIDLKLGNFYETIGRGLLLRSFEIPGALLEDRGYRSKQYFHRDILGFSAGYRYKNIGVKGIYGRPLSNTLPPVFTLDERRPDLIESVVVDYSFLKQTISSAYLIHKQENVDEMNQYSTIKLEGNILDDWSYYVEWAQKINKTQWFDFSYRTDHAFYSGINYTFGSLGVSLEYKNYKNFLLGSGFNEPPALVKEHSYRLLNRSTHVLQPQDEKGFQFESFYTFDNGDMLTLNATHAENNFLKKTLFQEYFVEFSTEMFSAHPLKLFVDLSQDPFNLRENIISTGYHTSIILTNNRELHSEVEYQTYKYNQSNVNNFLLILGYTFNHRATANFVVETSNDPLLTEKEKKWWLGFNGRYRIHQNHTIQIFGGQRRGGPACSAGVCYEVLDFEGVELRWISRF